ncbi:YSC84-related protein [uncultured Ramlibacter sp.]|uniref:BPSL1445 family SYLF domain-containing lipoprotein n=1 Tax=uncultured Ramlibacter sp. TaxID=260755 RepID=UPI0026043114|nr:YSC84-related protein [uncultured Ramlibacter sp.]
MSTHATPPGLLRRDLLLAACAAALAGCASPETESTPGARRRTIDAAVDHALSALYSQANGARDLSNRAHGILVFPSVVSAGLVVAGSHGHGALRKAGTSVAYYSVAEASVGLLAGAQSKAVYLFFMTPQALEQFESSAGWTAGVNASVVVADLSSGARTATQFAQQGIIVFIHSNIGLMAGLSLDGTKISRMAL